MSNKTTNWLLVVIICILLVPFKACGGCLFVGMSVDTEAMIEELDAEQEQAAEKFAEEMRKADEEMEAVFRETTQGIGDALNGGQ